MYHFNCECGEDIEVELFNAGSNMECPSCHRSVSVPSSVVLKKLAGDSHSFLSPIERIAQAVSERSAPFDGTCHRCHSQDASVEIPMDFTFLVERQVEDDGPHASPAGIVFHSGDITSEDWRRLHVPLFLCQQCYRSFDEERRRSETRGSWMVLVYSVGFAVALIVACFISFVLPVTLPLVLLVFWRIFKFRHRKKIDPYLVRWVSEIPKFGKVIVSEDEYQLSVGVTRSFRRSESKSPETKKTEPGERLDHVPNQIADKFAPGQFVTCLFCGVGVVVMANGGCPSCRRVMS